jgi:hypothetical protein
MRGFRCAVERFGHRGISLGTVHPSLPRGFGFGDLPTSWADRPNPGSWSYSGTDTLDARGRTEIRVADTARTEGTRSLSFSVSVEDVNRQAVTSWSQAVLFGSTHYLALSGGKRWMVVARRDAGARRGARRSTRRIARQR